MREQLKGQDRREIHRPPRPRRPAGEEKGGCGRTTFVGWGNEAGGGAGSAHRGQAGDLTRKGTPSRKRVPENPCPVAARCPPVLGCWVLSQLPANRLPGGVAGNTRTFPTSREVRFFSWPRSTPRSLSPACLPLQCGGLCSAPPHLSHFWLGHMARIFIPLARISRPGSPCSGGRLS